MWICRNQYANWWWNMNDFCDPGSVARITDFIHVSLADHIITQFSHVKVHLSTIIRYIMNSHWTFSYIALIARMARALQQHWMNPVSNPLSSQKILNYTFVLIFILCFRFYEKKKRFVQYRPFDTIRLRQISSRTNGQLGMTLGKGLLIQKVHLSGKYCSPSLRWNVLSLLL